MAIKIFYKPDNNMKIDRVSFIQYSSKENKETPMKKDGENWIFEKPFIKGEYMYAFLINGNLMLNDPMANMYAPDDKEKIWSVLLVDNNGKRLYNNKEYSVHIKSYLLSPFITEDKNLQLKRVYNKFSDEKVVARFTFKNVTGLHNATVAWYKPDGSLYQFSEQYLMEPEKQGEEIDLWFWLDLKKEKSKMPSGSWLLYLFIDGAYVLEDMFTINEKSTYSPFNN